MIKQEHIFTGGNNFEAIIGLAYPVLAENGMTPLFDSMMQQKMLENNLFAFYLTSRAEQAKGVESDLTFGYYDSSKFTGDIDWHPVVLKRMFSSRLDDIKVNGQPLNLCQRRKQGCIVTFDSGTQLFTMPKFAVESFKRHGLPTLKNKQECLGREQFGNLTFVINGKDYTMTAEEWLIAPGSMKLAQGGEPFEDYELGPLGP